MFWVEAVGAAVFGELGLIQRSGMEDDVEFFLGRARFGRGWCVFGKGVAGGTGEFAPRVKGGDADAFLGGNGGKGLGVR